MKKNTFIDIQGHRGCRGLMPENSIEGFIHAIDLGVTTLEMDVVISKDKKVVVSHEPFFSHEIALDTNGTEIKKEEEKKRNIYQMNYQEIKKFDCGSKIHSRFPEQKKIRVYKPLLEDVIDAVEKYTQKNGLNKVFYNIEIKCTPETDSIFHPAPKEFSDLLLEVLKKKYIENRAIIQSFDPRALTEIHASNPGIKTALLVENNMGVKENLARLDFTPTIYSPEFILLNDTTVQLLKSFHISVIPWTVNEPHDIQKMLNLAVDGIISDYPNRVIEIINKKS